MPRSSATQHELQRCGMLSGLPGETLGRLAKLMEREEIAPGTVVVRAGEPNTRIYLVFAGMLTTGGRSVLRPGDSFGADDTTVTAMTPCVIASCDRAAFDGLVKG